MSFKTWKLGDANGDWGVNILDIAFMIKYLYENEQAPNPKYVADVDGDCRINILDVGYLVSYLYKGGPEPKIGCQ